MLGFTPRQFRWTWLGFGATTALAPCIGRADVALYQAKDAGRNRFVMAP